MENLRSKFTHMLRDEKRCIPVNPVYLKEKSKEKNIILLKQEKSNEKDPEDIHSVLMKGWFLLIYKLLWLTSLRRFLRP